MKVKVLGLFLLLMSVCASSFAQVKLERKFEEGSTYTLEENSHTRQKLTIAGMNQDSNSDTTAVAKLTVGKRDGNGNLIQTEEVQSLQINISGFLGNYFFDSQNPDQNVGTSILEPGRAIHKMMTKIPRTMVLGKNNEVIEMKIDQSVFGSLPVELQDAVRAQLNPAKLKEAAQQQLDVLPKDAIKPGDTWTRTEKMALDALQSMTFDKKYTYEGTIEKDGRTLDKVVSEAQNVKYALETNPQLALKSSDLKVAKSSGTILFDRELGRAIENSSLVQIAGDMVFSQNGTDLPAKLDLTLEREVKLKK